MAVAGFRLKFSSFIKLFLVSLFCTLLFRRGSKFFRLQLNQSDTVGYEKVDILEEMDKDFLMFVRVPKTGSELVTKLLQTLSEKSQNFEHKRYGAPQPRRLDVNAQVRRKTMLN